MPAYPFLSDEWFVEVRRIFDDEKVDAPPGTSLGMNLVVIETPFGNDCRFYLVIEEGSTEWGLGHAETVDLTITTDYVTARALFAAGEPQAVLGALMEGKLKLQGDLTKLMAAQMAGAVPGSPGLASALAEITS